MTTLTLPVSLSVSSLLRTVFVRPFVAIGGMLVRAAEHRANAMGLAQLNAMTDAEFEARGTTRQQAIMRAIGRTF